MKLRRSLSAQSHADPVTTSLILMIQKQLSVWESACSQVTGTISAKACCWAQWLNKQLIIHWVIHGLSSILGGKSIWKEWAILCFCHEKAPKRHLRDTRSRKGGKWKANDRCHKAKSDPERDGAILHGLMGAVQEPIKSPADVNRLTIVRKYSFLSS